MGNTVADLSEPPRYVEIAKQIEARRPTLTQPLKLPPEQQLANEYSIARDTLRRALGLLERNGAVTRQRGRGRGTYLRPLRMQPTSAKGNSIGFVRPYWSKVTQEWYMSLLFDGVSQWSDEHDCRLSVLDVDRYERDEHKMLEKLAARELAGLVWVHPVPEQRQLLEVISRHVPCVVIGREYPGLNLHAVLPDYNQAMALIDEHLVANGHPKYSIIGRSPSDPYGASWLNAAKEAFERRGKVFKEQSYYINVAPFDRARLPELLMDFHLASLPRSEALVLTTSSYLADLLGNPRFSQSIPEKFSLLAFDYGIQSVRSYWPGRTITHVTCDWKEIGRKAVEVLFSVIEGKDAPPLILEPVRLVEGDTVQLAKK